MNKNQRKHPIFTRHLKLLITTEDKKTRPMETLDVSSQGLRLLTHEPYLVIEPGSMVKIKIPPQKTNSSEINLEGEIRHYSYERDGSGIFGIQLKKLDKETKAAWQRTIENLEKNK